MKFPCCMTTVASIIILLLNLQLVHCQNETLKNNLINALFAFVEGNTF